MYSSVIHLLFKGGPLFEISDNGSFWIVRCLGLDSKFKRVRKFYIVSMMFRNIL